MTSRRRTHAVWLALISSAVLGVQGANTAHLLLGRHGVCAEHGETIELDRASGPRAVGHFPAPAHQRERDGMAENTGDTSEHRHCELAVESRSARATLRPASPALEAPAPALVARTDEPRAPDAKIETYRIAPKASPPVLS